MLLLFLTKTNFAIAFLRRLPPEQASAPWYRYWGQRCLQFCIRKAVHHKEAVESRDWSLGVLSSAMEKDILLAFHYYTLMYVRCTESGLFSELVPERKSRLIWASEVVCGYLICAELRSTYRWDSCTSLRPLPVQHARLLQPTSWLDPGSIHEAFNHEKNLPEWP